MLTPVDTAIEWRGSVHLEATLRYGTGIPIPTTSPLASAQVEWLSENPAVATVSGSGVVRSMGPSGTAVIRATQGTLSATAQVTVLDSLLVARAKLPGEAYAAAISAAKVAYVGQTSQGRIVRANLPSRAFGQGLTVGSIPTEIAFNSTGTRAYVTNQANGTVSVINVAANAQIDTIPVGSSPFEVIVAPGDSILWVGNAGTVRAVRLATNTTAAQFQVGGIANGVAIARDTLLYVSTHTAGTVLEFNLRTRTLGRTFTVGGIPQKLVASPDGGELYIANQSGYIQFWNLDTGLQIGSNLILPSAAYGLARRSTNGLLYATSAYFGGGYLYVIDPVARTLLHSSIIGGSTRHVIFTADGSIGLVPNENGWVDFIR